jgi:large subunit ribosomal protein L13
VQAFARWIGRLRKIEIFGGLHDMKTFVPKPAEITRKWILVDAKGKTLGRMASEIASLLRGKHKPEFAPHTDTGDYIVVVNAAEVVLTGDKLEQKLYRYHTGYPGGLKEIKYRDMMAKNPAKVVELAVKGMLPKNTLGRAMFRKLFVYAGPDHEQTAQKPQALDIKVSSERSK